MSTLRYILLPVEKMSSRMTVSEAAAAAVEEEGRGWRTRRSCRHRVTVVSVSAVVGNSGDEVA